MTKRKEYKTEKPKKSAFAGKKIKSKKSAPPHKTSRAGEKKASSSFSSAGKYKRGFALRRRDGAKKSSAGEKNLMRGIIDGTGKNYAFFVPDDGGGDLFIGGSKLHGAIEGDVVRVFALSAKEGGGEGEVAEIIDSPNSQFVGTVRGRDVIPDIKGMPAAVRIGDCGEKYSDGDKVYALFTDKGADPQCRILEKLGLAGNTDAEVLSAIRSYRIEENFSVAVQEEAAAINGAISAETRAAREDFTGDTVITIDGAHSKDFDDAVCVKRLPGGGFRLYVHIADVTEYVKEGGAIDNDALKRGTSVYFSDRVIPMLPEILCNDVCSLVEGKERLVLSCIIDYSAEGEVTSKRISEGVIRSAARTTYDEIYSFFRGDAAMREKYSFLEEMLSVAEELYRILNKKRLESGSIEFDFIETEITVDEKGEVTDVRAAERNDAHRLIEEFMLAANAAVASLYDRIGIPMVYRVHAAPPPEKKESLAELLKTLGIKLPDDPTPADISEMLASVEPRFKELVNMATLRSMSKAEYKASNDGHYGLNFPDYCHFTSPIRRYPDLAVHRMVKKYISGSCKNIGKYAEWVKEVSRISSAAERRAEEAERKVDDILTAKYMEKKTGEIYPAKISGVTEWGVFARLDNGIEGCVRIEKLKDGVYSYDEKTYSLVCEKKRYRLGDETVVRVDDVTDGRINFSFVGSEVERCGKKNRTASE